MLLQQFPNLEWIQKQSKSNFSNQLDVDNNPIDKQGWPSVVLNTFSTGTERTNIVAPFSIFMNESGSSILRTDGEEVVINNDTYCLANKGSTYDLIIPEGKETKTFNIHFGEQLFKDTLYSFIKNDEYLLSNPLTEESELNHFIFARWKKEPLDHLVRSIKGFYGLPQPPAKEEELLSELLLYLLSESSFERKGFKSIDTSKKSTRNELHRRLLIVISYLHDHYKEDVSLDVLSNVAMLSKFHLLRLFKACFGKSPHQYLLRIRLEKSRDLIRKTTLSNSEVAFQIGYEEVNSFYRFFKKEAGMTVSEFRSYN